MRTEEEVRERIGELEAKIGLFLTAIRTDEEAGELSALRWVVGEDE